MDAVPDVRTEALLLEIEEDWIADSMAWKLDANRWRLSLPLRLQRLSANKKVGRNQATGGGQRLPGPADQSDIHEFVGA